MKEVMFELKIATAPDALRIMRDGWPSRIISLVGDDFRFELPCLGPHHFIARFHDVESEADGFLAPTEDQLDHALKHVAALGDGDRLLVHCHAGKSRSPAMAIGILVAAGLTPRAALDHVKSLRPFIIPNRLMIRMLDDLLQQEGELLRVIEEHYASLPAEAALPNRGGWNE